MEQTIFFEIRLERSIRHFVTGGCVYPVSLFIRCVYNGLFCAAVFSDRYWLTCGYSVGTFGPDFLGVRLARGFAARGFHCFSTTYRACPTAFRPQTHSDRYRVGERSATFFAIGCRFHDLPAAKNIFPFGKIDEYIQLKDLSIFNYFVSAIYADKFVFDGVDDFAIAEKELTSGMGNYILVWTFPVCGLHSFLLVSGCSRLNNVTFIDGQSEPDCSIVVFCQVIGFINDVQKFYDFAGLGNNFIAVSNVFSDLCLHTNLLFCCCVGNLGNLLHCDQRILAVENATVQALDGDFDNIVIVPAIDLTDLLDLVDSLRGEGGGVLYFLGHVSSFLNFVRICGHIVFMYGHYTAVACICQ
jgi:hypothetical protein